MIGYLVYVYHKHLKVEKIYVSEYYKPAFGLTTFDKIDGGYFTKVSGLEMDYKWGKIWCRNESDIENCKNIIRRHYRETGRELFEEGEPESYKRTKNDSYKKCPHCGAQYNNNFKKKYWKTIYYKGNRKTIGMCYKCKKWFSIITDYNLGKSYINPDISIDEYNYVMESVK